MCEASHLLVSHMGTPVPEIGSHSTTHNEGDKMNKVRLITRVAGALLLAIGAVIPIWGSVYFHLGSAEQMLHVCLAVGALLCATTLVPRTETVHTVVIVLVGALLLVSALGVAVIVLLQDCQVQSWYPFLWNGAIGLLLMLSPVWSVANPTRPPKTT
jgi:hypothetical protein